MHSFFSELAKKLHEIIQLVSWDSFLAYDWESKSVSWYLCHFAYFLWKKKKKDYSKTWPPQVNCILNFLFIRWTYILWKSEEELSEENSSSIPSFNIKHLYFLPCFLLPNFKEVHAIFFKRLTSQARLQQFHWPSTRHCSILYSLFFWWSF